MRIQCPCGLVDGHGRDRRAGRPAGSVSRAFRRSPSPATPSSLTTEWGPVTLDIGYGGAFYAVLPASTLGLDLAASPVARLVEAAMARQGGGRWRRSRSPTPTIRTSAFSTAPSSPTTPARASGEPTANVCVFADGQVDRSPTGSGVTARLALMHRRGQVATGASRVFRSITGAEFAGRVIATTRAGPHPAVTVEVAGQAYYAGEARFWREPDDPLGGGFLLRR